MNTRLSISTFLVGMLLAFITPSAWSNPAQQPTDQQPASENSSNSHSAKQDMKNAGHESKNGAKDVGRSAKDAGRDVKKGTEKGYHSSRKDAEKGWHKTRNTTKGAVQGGKAGAKQPDK